MIKFKNIFKYFIIVLLIAVSLSGIKVIEVNAGDEGDPYESISNYGINH
ncbi:MAG: hypothetical protein WBL93_07685 [Lutisporaceae bacterium]